MVFRSARSRILFIYFFYYYYYYYYYYYCYYCHVRKHVIVRQLVLGSAVTHVTFVLQYLLYCLL